MINEHPEDICDANDFDLVSLYNMSIDGMGGITWPDGKALLDQPVQLVQAFGIIGHVKAKLRKKSGD